LQINLTHNTKQIFIAYFNITPTSTNITRESGCLFHILHRSQISYNHS